MSRKTAYETPQAELNLYFAADVVLASGLGDNDGENPWSEDSSFQENGGAFNG